MTMTFLIIILTLAMFLAAMFTAGYNEDKTQGL